MPEAPSLELKPDCERCCGLCCIAPAFTASSDFAVSKPAGKPCFKLTTDFRCSIHERLRPEGFPGCIAYDCFGAGQKVTEVTFGGRTWRSSPRIAGQMFEVFGVMQQLHSMLRYLAEALEMDPGRPLSTALQSRLDEIRVLSEGTPEELMAVDLKSLRLQTDDLLVRFSKLVRR